MTNRRRDSSQQPMPADHIGVLIAALFMMLVGWGGLFLLITTTQPLIAERWMGFVLLHIAITSTALPFVRYINMRFTAPNTLPPPGGVVVRQSVWVGLYAVLCAWLQIIRVLSAPIIIFLPLVFVAVEIFIRSREIEDDFE